MSVFAPEVAFPILQRASNICVPNNTQNLCILVIACTIVMAFLDCILTSVLNL